MILVEGPCSLVSNCSSSTPRYGTTLIGEHCIGAGPIGYQNPLKGVCLHSEVETDVHMKSDYYSTQRLILHYTPSNIKGQSFHSYWLVAINIR